MVAKVKDMFCSSNKLKKKVNKEGAYCVSEISICEGVMNIRKIGRKFQNNIFY